jgi:hypothetical protein
LLKDEVTLEQRLAVGDALSLSNTVCHDGRTTLGQTLYKPTPITRYPFGGAAAQDSQPFPKDTQLKRQVHQQLRAGEHELNVITKSPWFQGFKGLSNG